MLLRLCDSVLRVAILVAIGLCVLTPVASADDATLARQVTLATYVGGDSLDYGTAVAVDAQGYIYLLGVTLSTDFPTVNALQPAYGGKWDVYAMKLDPSGQNVIYSTYLGGSGNEYGRSVNVDDQGRAYIVGSTFSTDFPVLNPLQSANHGSADLFITILDASGALEFSTYLGGSGNDGYMDANGYGNGVTSALQDRTLCVASGTNSTDFPVLNALQATPAGNSNCVVVKFDLESNQLVFSTYLGGSDSDLSNGIRIDSGGNVIVAITTSSVDFPTINAFQGNKNGTDAAIAKFSPSGSSLLFSSYFGGSAEDYVGGLDIDAQDNIWIVGATYSVDLTTKGAIQVNNAGRLDQFMACISGTGDSLLFSTYYGGTDNELNPSSILVESDGSVDVVSMTQSDDFPIQNASIPPCKYGPIVMIKMSAAGTLIGSSYLPSGKFLSWPAGCALGASSNLYITGDTMCNDFPSFNPLKWSLMDKFDGYLLRIAPSNGLCGDADSSGAVGISDVVLLLNYIFAGASAPAYLSGGDPDGNGRIGISDAVYLITYIFAGGPSPCSGC